MIVFGKGTAQLPSPHCEIASGALKLEAMAQVEAAFDVLQCNDAMPGAPTSPSEFAKVSGGGDQRSGALEAAMGTSRADLGSYGLMSCVEFFK